MTPVSSYRDLDVWQKSMALAERCYALSRRLPSQDQCVLGRQVRKSAVSAPSNIAEGHERRFRRVYLQQLWIAHGSTAELETQLELCRRVGVISDADSVDLLARAAEVGRMLRGLIRALAPDA